MRARSTRLAIVGGILLPSFLIGAAASPAAAGSGLGFAANAAVIPELVGQIPPSAEVADFEAQKIASATSTATGAAGMGVKPRAGGKLGMVINTVGVLSGLAILWPGGEDAPAIQYPQAQPADTWMGSTSWGWTNVAGFVSMSGTATNVFVDFRPAPAGANYFCTWFSHNGGSGGAAPAGNPVQFYRFPSGTVPGKPYVQMMGKWDFGNGSTCNGVMPSVGPLFRIANQGETVANPSTPGTPAPDPALVPRYIDSEIICKNGAGASQVIKSREGPFTFDPTQPTTLPEVPDLACPAGTWLKSGKREMVTEGSPTVIPMVTPYEAPDWLADQVTKYPECMPVGTVACQLEVVKIGINGDTDLNCNGRLPYGPAHACAKWASDPERNTKYQCKFGPYVAPMKNCLAYKDLFASDVLTSSPEEETPPGDVVVTWIDPSPEDTPDDSDCVPNTATGLLNPVWIYKATKCALVWAFVPETALSARMDSLTTGVSTKFPFSLFSGLGSIPALIPNSDCPQWTVKVGSHEKLVVCNSSYIERLRDARPMLAVFMGALAIWPLVRSTAYAAFPIIKPQPGVLR